jgi:DNA topoisomerase VI B subunit
MPPKKKAKSTSGRSGRVQKKEQAQQKSAAAFFADNQAIAGFDNPGKALYTTIRELVENSLDAAESIQVLPSIQLTITELTQTQFDGIRGSKKRERGDGSLYDDREVDSKGRLVKIKKSAAGAPAPGAASQELPPTAVTGMPAPGEGNAPDIAKHGSVGVAPSQEAMQPPAKKKKKRGGPKRLGFYKIVCRDNGMGMPTDKVGDMLGRVLSGSKYGLRQTRGKFGLGAKMALIWSKKSTGLPIHIRTAYGIDGRDVPGPTVSSTSLDIDILKNQPNILSQEVVENTEKWRGTEFTVVIEGNWQWSKSKVQQYMSSLAVVTPFAEFTLTFDSEESPGKSFELKYERRSERIPPPAQTIEYHPKSVNQLTVKQLIDVMPPATRLSSFLNKKFQCISTKLAARLVQELGYDPKIKLRDIGDEQQIHNITQLLRHGKFPDPSGKCLSPAGEYNLKLGILKEFNPDACATGQSKVEVFDGHPFIVEAGVSIGGATKEGIQVYRFANRIPLLFEQGSDVVTKVAKKEINWTSYHINKNNDKIGVFVSIVSTKIPFKGTGKEFISADNKIYYTAIKNVIRKCCNVLKHSLKKRKANKANAERTRALERYVPSVCRAIVSVLKDIKKGKNDEQNQLLKAIKKKDISETELIAKLKESIQKHDENELARMAAKGGLTIKSDDRIDLFLKPIDAKDASNFAFDLHNSSGFTPSITFRLLKGLMKQEEETVAGECAKTVTAAPDEGVIDLS